jgi:hypothetical protein
MAEIAELTRRNPVTVNTYIQSDQLKRLNGLAMGVATRAPERLTLEQTMLSKLSHKVWGPAKHNWTMYLAAASVKRDIEQSCTITSVANGFTGWSSGLPD